MSPPPPAASSGNAPSGRTTAVGKQQASSASRSPLFGEVSAVGEKKQSASSSGEGPVSSKPAVHEDTLTLPTVQEAQSVPPIHGGALGGSSSASLAPAERDAEAAAVADDGAGVVLSRTASYGPSDEAGHRFGWPGGDKEAGGLVNLSAARPDGEKDSGRGYMGKRFIQAAEVRYVVEIQILYLFNS